jgi:hypothetical protein
VTDQPQRRSADVTVRGLGDVVGWTFARERTQTLARQTQQLLESRQQADELAGRVQDLSDGQAGGHVFEWLEKVKFNRDAIAEGSSHRATTTAELGDRTAPGDVVIRGPEGKVQTTAQTKAYDDPDAAADVLADPKYEGMDRVVPAGQESEVRDHTEQHLRPDSPDAANYEDVNEKLKGRLEHDGVESSGTTREELERIGKQPDEWIERQIGGSVLDELATSVGVGATVGAEFGAVFSATHNALQVRRGELDGAKAIVDTVSATAAAAARGGSRCGLAKAVQLAARNSDQLRHFATGLGSVAIATVVSEIGASGYRLATGEITHDVFAEQSGGAVLRSSSAWAFGVAGQTVLPVPVLGGLVGAGVGYVASATIVEGLTVAHEAARDADAAEAELARLEAWIYDSIQRLEETRAAIEAQTELHQEHFEAVLNPAMDSLESRLAAGQLLAFDELDTLCRQLDSSLPFASFEEFEGFMADRDQVLEL